MGIGIKYIYMTAQERERWWNTANKPTAARTYVPATPFMPASSTGCWILSMSRIGVVMVSILADMVEFTASIRGGGKQVGLEQKVDKGEATVHSGNAQVSC